MPTIPHILVGHSRDITHVTFNRDGDLLFTCSKDGTVQVWRTKDGTRIGSYDCSGAVQSCDPTARSEFLVAASGDGTARVFEIETGKMIAEYDHASPVRHATWAIANEMFAVVQNNGKKNPSRVVIWDFPANDLPGTKIKRNDQDPEDGPLRTLQVGPQDPALGAFHKCVFTNPDFHLLAIHTDGHVSLWDSGEEKLIKHVKLTSGLLTDIKITNDRGLALITSRDHKAYLIKTDDLSLVKTYQSDRPLNCCAISPVMNHTLLAGGQDKHEVTLSDDGGHFEIEFWHTIYLEKLTEVVGHYGPVNSLAISRDGKMFCSGSEDGNVRLYHFDEGYFKTNY
eukprot:UN01772